MLNRYSEFEVV